MALQFTKGKTIFLSKFGRNNKMIQRFFYNPDNGKLDLFNNSHVEYYHNNKEKFSLPFDNYIRGVIKEDILFLRVYYPYEDIDTLSFEALIDKSNALLGLYQKAIVKALKLQGVKINHVSFSCTNEELKEALHSLYV